MNKDKKFIAKKKIIVKYSDKKVYPINEANNTEVTTLLPKLICSGV